MIKLFRVVNDQGTILYQERMPIEVPDFRMEYSRPFTAHINVIEVVTIEQEVNDGQGEA